MMRVFWFGHVSLEQFVAPVEVGVGSMGGLCSSHVGCICYRMHHAWLRCTQGLFKGLSGFQLCSPALPCIISVVLTAQGGLWCR